ncbi:hypothetical protein KAW64_16705 [bacterium]|nr:hypothetical protein [bacterium]
MNSKRLIVLSLVLFGSLWGLSELGLGEMALSRSIPRAPILTAIGIIFLVLARRLWATPGSSLSLAAIAGAFKFLQHPVWGCKIAAVLMVGAIFDIAFSMYEARQTRRAESVSVGGVLAISAFVTFASFIAFGPFAKYVLLNPYWSIAGKMNDYMFVQGAIATVLAIPAAWAGLTIARKLLLASERWTDARWAVYRVAAVGSGVAGVAAALALRY